MPVCLRVHHKYTVPTEVRKRHVSHGTGATGACDMNLWDQTILLCMMIKYS